MWFIDGPEHGHDILVLRLRDEFSQESNIIQRALSVGEAHGTIKHIDGAEFAGMVPSILTARESVEIEINAKAVLARPSNRLEEVPGEL